MLIFHRLQVQHDAALMAQGANRHHKVLVGRTVIGERTVDTFAIEGDPGWLAHLDQRTAPSVEQLNQRLKVNPLQHAAKRRVGRNASLIVQFEPTAQATPVQLAQIS